MRDFSQLQSFRSVAAAGSVRSAAGDLGLSPSAVSHQLKMLEGDLGFAVFVRRGRGLELTAEGRSLLRPVDEVFLSLSQLDKRVREIVEKRSDALSVGYFASAANRWLPELVAFLEHTYPDVSVRLSLTEGIYVDRELDVQIVVSDGRQTQIPRHLRQDFLIDDPYLVALPVDHRLAQADRVTLADISAEECIRSEINSGACAQVLDDACARAGVALTGRHEAHGFQIALEMVARGLGVTVLPALGAVGVPDGVTLRRISRPEPIRYIHAVSMPGHPNSDLINDTLEALRKLAKENSELPEN